MVHTSTEVYSPYETMSTACVDLTSLWLLLGALPIVTTLSLVGSLYLIIPFIKVSVRAIPHPPHPHHPPHSHPIIDLTNDKDEPTLQTKHNQLSTGIQSTTPSTTDVRDISNRVEPIPKHGSTKKIKTESNHTSENTISLVAAFNQDQIDQKYFKVNQDFMLGSTGSSNLLGSTGSTSLLGSTGVTTSSTVLGSTANLIMPE